MMYAVIVILIVLLTISLVINIWLSAELERIHRESEMEWGEPDLVDFTWEDEE